LTVGVIERRWFRVEIEVLADKVVPAASVTKSA
jgi:hypothetical protein